MTFLETANQLKNFLQTSEGLKCLNNTNIDSFFKIINDIEKDFSLLSNNEEVKINEDLIKSIISTFDVLRHHYFSNPISKDFSNFCINFSILVFNWNENVAKNDNIKSWSLIIERFYTNNLTSQENIDILKIILNQLKKYQVFALPSIELSRQYLDAFDEKEQDKNENCSI